jgi:hypothetical protein
MYRNNKCFLDNDKTLELSWSDNNPHYSECVDDKFKNISLDQIINNLRSKIKAVKISFGANSDDLGLANIGNADILYSISFQSNSDIDESIELKLSLAEFINELIFKMNNYDESSEDFEEIILISKSLNSIANKLQEAIQKNSNVIDELIIKDTSAW